MSNQNLPSIDDLLGVTEKAQQDADTLLGMAINKRRLEQLMQDEGLKPSDPIPGQMSNGSAPKTFAEHIANIKRAYTEKWKRIEAEGHRANVEELLSAPRK